MEVYTTLWIKLQEDPRKRFNFTFCFLASCVRLCQRSSVSALPKLYLLRYRRNPWKKISVPRTSSSILIMAEPWIKTSQKMKWKQILTSSRHLNMKPNLDTTFKIKWDYLQSRHQLWIMWKKTQNTKGFKIVSYGCIVSIL